MHPGPDRDIILPDFSEKDYKVTKTFVIRLLFWVALISVTVLSLLPIDHPDMAPNDKLNHLVAWGTLAVLTGLGWRHQNWRFSVLLAYSFVIELAQGLSGYRMFSLADGFANALGILLAIIVVRLWYKVEARFDRSRGY